MADVLLVEVCNGVSILTLNRPAVLNAIDAELGKALADAVADAARSSEVRCVVVTGAGRAFCAGGDLKAITKNNVSADRTADLGTRIDALRAGMTPYRRLHEMGKPTIAMINGACAGVAMSLAGACDFRFVAKSAILTTAYAKIGLSGDGGGSWFWTQILGTAKARRLYMLAEKFDGEAAAAFGLVHEVWPDEELRQRTLAVASTLAAAPPAALRFAKEALNAAEEGSFDQALKIEAITHALSGAARSPK